MKYNENSVKSNGKTYTTYSNNKNKDDENDEVITV